MNQMNQMNAVESCCRDDREETVQSLTVKNNLLINILEKKEREHLRRIEALRQQVIALIHDEPEYQVTELCRVTKDAVRQRIVECFSHENLLPHALAEVQEETTETEETTLGRETNTFPEWPIDPVHAAAIVADECGKLQQAILHRMYEPPKFKETDYQDCLHFMSINDDTASLCLIRGITTVSCKGLPCPDFKEQRRPTNE